MAEHNLFGEEGEDEATAYMLRMGYHLRHRNWRSGHKELDLVAEKAGELVVVEVKTRHDNRFGDPEGAVTAAKIRKIVNATDAYLRQFQLDMPVRFDVITLVGEKGNQQIEHIEDAFFPPLTT